MMKIFETHAHYDDEAFREDREALFDEMFANDIDDYQCRCQLCGL